jgi:hypothetical protein
MTLNTSIAIGKPHNVREIFDFCNTLLGAPETVRFEQDRGTIRNEPMQGLSAWLWINYGVDGPMVHLHDEFCETEVGPAKWDDEGKYSVTQDDVDRHNEWVARTPTASGWAAIEVTFDTAYGYRGEGGESCSDLHARLVTALGRWCDARDLPWKWQNEYTAEWHDGFDGLDDFGNAHRATGADDWFQNLALPAIRAHIAGGAS